MVAIFTEQVSLGSELGGDDGVLVTSYAGGGSQLADTQGASETLGVLRVTLDTSSGRVSVGALPRSPTPAFTPEP